MQEELLATAFAAVAEKHGAEIKELFDVDVVVPTVPFRASRSPRRARS
jgi:aspartyl-tRNA synthetase